MWGLLPETTRWIDSTTAWLLPIPRREKETITAHTISPKLTVHGADTFVLGLRSGDHQPLI